MKHRLLAFVLVWVGILPAAAQPSLKGTFNGLFFDTNGIAPQSSGAFTLTSTDAGVFSGKLQFASGAVSFKGKFDSSGKTNLNLTAKNIGGLNLSLALSAGRLRGSLSNAAWIAQIACDRAIFDSKTNLAPQAGRYTFVLFGESGAIDHPEGHSYATVVVDAAGRVSVSGSLADGTKFTQSAVVATNQSLGVPLVNQHARWPLLVSPYGGRGLLLGWIAFSDDSPPVLAGNVEWFKFAGAKAKLYNLGFTNASVANGWPYAPPPTGTRLMDFVSGWIEFSGGELGAPFADPALLTVDNQLRNPGAVAFSVKFTPATGLLKGTAVDPGSHGALLFNGVVSQATGEAYGYFAGTARSGQVFLQPEPEDVVDVLTLGNSFSPEVYLNHLPDLFQWLWSDGTGAAYSPIVTKTVGKGARHQYLTAYPGGTVYSINLGFDGSDGGQNTPLSNRPPQNVAGVSFPYPLVGLHYWASSYTAIAGGLDFTGFGMLEAIECFHCSNLRRVGVTNLPSLRRLCLEACDLRELDLTGDPALEDVRAALNVFTNVVVANGTGPNIWHWCTRNNPNITQHFQDVMTNFVSLQELWIWDDNQSGALSVVSPAITSVKANDNEYASADFSGKLNLQECWLFNNRLTTLSVAGCVNLRDLQAYGNQLGGPALDALLVELAALLPTVGPGNLQTINLTNNPGIPSPIGLAAYSLLTNHAVIVNLDLP